MSGTSMASPTVAGVAALLFAQDPGRSPAEVRGLIQASASCIGVAPIDSPLSSYSFDGVREGVVDAAAALGLAAPACP